MDPIAAMRRVYTATCDAHGCEQPAEPFADFCTLHELLIADFAHWLDHSAPADLAKLGPISGKP